MFNPKREKIKLIESFFSKRGEVIDFLSLSAQEQEKYLQTFQECMEEERKQELQRERELEKRKKEEKENIRRMQKLKSFEMARFENADMNSLDEMQTKVAKLLANRGGIIYSPIGGFGKTHTLLALTKYLILNRGIDVEYVTAFDLFNNIKKCFRNNSEPDKYLEKFIECDFLIIDEIDKSYGTKTEDSYLFDIINKRYNMCKNSVLSGNFQNSEEISETLGDPIVSRLCHEGRIMRFDKTNYRAKPLQEISK